jgi:hypothetical protein
MKHFLITRFNLKDNFWNTDRSGSEVLTNEWLDNRIKLFAKYCLPSVLNQTNKNFYWLIFFNSDTPIFYKNEIDKLISGFDYIYPYFIDGMNALIGSLKNIIDEKIEEEDKFIITSRLDNDDIIHKDFIEIIQKNAIWRNTTIIDLCNGYQLDISNNYFDCRKYNSKLNPFISIVEDSKDFRTIFDKKHNDWNDAELIIEINDIALWIQLIHKRNKLNEPKVNLPLMRKINYNNFNLNIELKRRCYFYMLANNIKLKIINFKNRVIKP